MRKLASYMTKSGVSIRRLVSSPVAREKRILNGDAANRIPHRLCITEDEISEHDVEVAVAALAFRMHCLQDYMKEKAELLVRRVQLLGACATAVDALYYGV